MILVSYHFILYDMTMTKDTNQAINWQKTPHSLPLQVSYGVYFMSI